MSNGCTRAAMVPVTRRIRAYCAAVDRTSGSPAIFDPAKWGMFQLATAPAPWIDLGWIDSFERFSGTSAESVRAGPANVASVQYRSSVNARIEFDFREWGKLQMALAGGVQHMNVLEADPNADPEPLGGTPLTAVAILAGSTANEIQVGAGAVNRFAAGDMIAVDVDYTQQTGYVGTGVAGAFVRSPADVLMDPHYIRRVTFNVGRVASTTATSLLLEQALLGGVPANGSSAQKIVAFADREGGSFLQEWSAVFVMEEQSGGRICFYYPRLSASTSNPGAAGFVRERKIEIAEPIAAVALHAAFVALPYRDRNDNEIAVCYRSYFPARAAALY